MSRSQGTCSRGTSRGRPPVRRTSVSQLSHPAQHPTPHELQQPQEGEPGVTQQQQQQGQQAELETSQETPSQGQTHKLRQPESTFDQAELQVPPHTKSASSPGTHTRGQSEEHARFHARQPPLHSGEMGQARSRWGCGTAATAPPTFLPECTTLH